MKRTFILLAAAALAAVSCSTTRIYMDSTTAEGERKIVTTQQSFAGSFSGDLSFSLGVSLKGRDTIMAVIAIIDAETGHGVFNRGNQLMFRLADGEEIILTNLIDKEYEETQETHTSQRWKTDYGLAYAYGYAGCYVVPYEINRMVPEVYTTRSNCSYALYLITRQQMADILEKKVVKLRVEIEDQDLDFVQPDSEHISDIFESELACLIDRVYSKKSDRTEF